MEGQSGQKDHFLISINDFLILINDLLISKNHLLILENHLIILRNHCSFCPLWPSIYNWLVGGVIFFNSVTRAPQCSFSRQVLWLACDWLMKIMTSWDKHFRLAFVPDRAWATVTFWVRMIIRIIFKFHKHICDVKPFRQWFYHRHSTAATSAVQPSFG